jgi:hypothetical protein
MYDNEPDDLRHSPVSLDPGLIDGPISAEDAEQVTRAIRDALAIRCFGLLGKAFDTDVADFLQAKVTKGGFFHGKVLLAILAPELSARSDGETNARVLFEGSFVKGILDGPIKYSCEGGRTFVFSGKFSRSSKNGEFQTCDSQGNPVEYCKFRQNLRNGIREKFHSDYKSKGYVRTRSVYKNDDRVGAQIFFPAEDREKSKLWSDMGDTALKLDIVEHRDEGMGWVARSIKEPKVPNLNLFRHRFDRNRYIPKIFLEETQYQYQDRKIGAYVADIYELLGFSNSDNNPKTLFNDIFIELLHSVLEPQVNEDIAIFDRLDAVQQIVILLDDYYLKYERHRPITRPEYFHSYTSPGVTTIQSIFEKGADALPSESYNVDGLADAARLYMAWELRSQAFERFVIERSVFITSIDYALNLSKGNPPGTTELYPRYYSTNYRGFFKFLSDARPSRSMVRAAHATELAISLGAGFVAYQYSGASSQVWLSLAAAFVVFFVVYRLIAAPRVFFDKQNLKHLAELASHAETNARHLIEFNQRAIAATPGIGLALLKQLRKYGFYFPAIVEELWEYRLEVDGGSASGNARRIMGSGD